MSRANRTGITDPVGVKAMSIIEPALERLPPWVTWVMRMRIEAQRIRRRDRGPTTKRIDELELRLWISLSGLRDEPRA